MIIFIPGDENNSLFYKKNLEFSVYYHILSFWIKIDDNFISYLFIYILEEIVRQETSGNTKNAFHCSEKKTENENNISSISLNIYF